MNIHEMTIEQLQGIKISSVEQGRNLADEILEEQLDVHRQMVGLYQKDEWQKLSDRHYELRKVRYQILNVIGQMVIKKKNLRKR